MKIGVQGIISSDLSDVDYNMIRWVADLGFHGLAAHLSVPAGTIPDDRAAKVKATFADQDMPFLQLWGPYPSIVSPDESVRRAGVAGASEVVKLAAKMGVPGSGVRPTSLNPRGDYAPHPDNDKPETEDRLVKSLTEIAQVADDYGVDIVLETHITTTLNSAQSIKRIIERTGSKRIKVNLDPCNFIGDLPTAFNPAPMIKDMFATIKPYIAAVHVKDYYLEDRFVVHISETVIGTGLMDWDTVLTCSYEANPDGYVIIEHLPVSLIALAKRNLTEKINALNIPLG